MYFVAMPGGRHAFSRTLAEHNRAVAEARRARDTASAPRRP
jgi:cell division protein YceG involved in septum cleavage